MKQILRHAFVAPLYAAALLLLCFGSCQSSDNARAGEGASVASLPLTAQIGETSSRVVMSDVYGGAFTCYWNSDQLSIYHKYVLSGAVQSMGSLAFGTSATNTTTATFSYAGGTAQRYNPGARLYAFSSNAGGGYTTSVSDAGIGSLTATALASQNGTLADCATYDALYGSASVDYSTGLPGSLAMHHLFGMLNLHLTSSSFSTSYPVTVTLTSSAANILPGNNGNVTFKVDGIPNATTAVWGTSWTATITPTTAGVVDVYLMTWPFSATNGTLTISCSDASEYVYTPLTVTISNFSLAAAQIKSKELAITSTPFVFDSSKLFAWDATDYKPVTLNTVPTNANTTTVASSDADYSSRAFYACKNCPNANAITWYLSVQYYWDDGNQSAIGGNTTSYTLANGTTTKAGMWFRKQSGIGDFSSTAAFTGTMVPSAKNLSEMPSDELSRLSIDYFFLPAAGSTSSGAFGYGGSLGRYWSSSPSSYTTDAYYLTFYSGGADLYSLNRTHGFSLWQAQ